MAKITFFLILSQKRLVWNVFLPQGAADNNVENVEHKISTCRYLYMNNHKRIHIAYSFVSSAVSLLASCRAMIIWTVWTTYHEVITRSLMRKCNYMPKSRFGEAGSSTSNWSKLEQQYRLNRLELEPSWSMLPIKKWPRKEDDAWGTIKLGHQQSLSIIQLVAPIVQCF